MGIFLTLLLDMGFPLESPILKFTLILIVILLAPSIFEKLRLPNLLGLIIAGTIIGPHGFNLIARDSGIVMSGTVGLLYLMFLAGIEMNLRDFRQNYGKSLVFGALTFLIPMILGTLSGIYILEFSPLSSILLASMFASHTLIAYPILGKYGITKNRAVTVAVGGTIFTDVLALLVLAVIVGIVSGESGFSFWTKFSISVIVFILIVIWVFPILGKWFFKRIHDEITQYIFVLALVFVGASLAEISGIEGMIGAFLVGLSINGVISHRSALMGKIKFVGNAIFIPFFLISVGMLVDYAVFFQNIQTVKVAVTMILIATSAKFIAAWLTQKSLKFSADERRLLFGLSNAQAAATLAAVLVGYNLVIGENEIGEPIRVFNADVLNGTIMMILVTCTIATRATQKGAKNIASNADKG